MTGVLIQGDTWRELQVRTKAEMGVMQLQTKEHKRLAANHQKRQGSIYAPTCFKGSKTLLTP